MPIKIKTLNIRACRGIPERGLDLDGKSLLILGENGSGKSSIVDAIEFFFTGKIEHLEGTEGLSLQKHGANINYTPNDTEITMIFNP